MKLPLRKSPCTSSGRGGGGGRAFAEPPQPELERGMRLAEAVEQRAVLVDLRRPRRAPGARGSVAGSIAWMRAAISPHCAARRGPGVGVRVVAENLPGNRLAVDAVHDEAAAEVVVGRAAARARGARRRRPPRPPSHSRYSVERSDSPTCSPGSRRSTRPARLPSAADEVERPRLPGRAAREPAQVLDRPGAARRRHARASASGSGGRATSGTLATPIADTSQEVPERRRPTSEAAASVYLHTFSTGP